MSDYVYRRTYRGPLRAALLDWAGTAVDFGCMAPVRVFVEVFRERGIEITVEEARAPMGVHKRDHLRAIARMPRVAELWQLVHSAPCTEADVEAMFARFLPQQLQTIPQHAGLVPGILEAQAEFRRRGMKIGTCSGYSREIMALLAPAAAAQGYAPDCVACATDVPAGRPAPWMAFRSAMELGVYPMAAWVKIGDTPADIAEGLNAGMWSVGVVCSGNEVGLTQAELARVDAAARAARYARARERLLQAGAHYVIDTLAEVPALLQWIELRLQAGEQP